MSEHLDKARAAMEHARIIGAELDEDDHEPHDRKSKAALRGELLYIAELQAQLAQAEALQTLADHIVGVVARAPEQAPRHEGAGYV